MAVVLRAGGVARWWAIVSMWQYTAAYEELLGYLSADKWSSKRPYYQLSQVELMLQAWTLFKLCVPHICSYYASSGIYERPFLSVSQNLDSQSLLTWWLHKSQQLRRHSHRPVPPHPLPQQPPTYPSLVVIFLHLTPSVLPALYSSHPSVSMSLSLVIFFPFLPAI